MVLMCCTQYVSKFGKPSNGHRTTLSIYNKKTLIKEVREGIYLNIIKTIKTKITANIILSGEKSKAFKGVQSVASI